MLALHVVPADDVEPEDDLLYPSAQTEDALMALVKDQVGRLVKAAQDAHDVASVIGDDRH